MKFIAVSPLIHGVQIQFMKLNHQVEPFCTILRALFQEVYLNSMI